MTVQRAAEEKPGFTERVPVALLDSHHKTYRERTEQEGWLHDGSQSTEGEILMVLHALVRATKPAICVETGTFAGFGTRAIMEALEANGKGFLHTVEIDPEIVVELWKLNDKPRVKFHCADSTVWCRDEAPEGIDFAYVDSGPEGRVEDIRGLWPKMNSGGLLCVHDTLFLHNMLALAEEELGPVGLHIPSLNGLGIWSKP